MSRRIQRMGEITAVALMAVMIAALVRAFCHAVFNEAIPYTPFYPAIVVSTMYGRMMGGAIATVLAAFVASFWLEPFGHPLIQESTDLVGLFLFLMVSVLVVRLCEAMRRAQETAENATKVEQGAVVREQMARIDAEDANRLKDQFLASASHELRTPLQAILGWAQLLMRNDLEEKDRFQGLDIIERNARVQSRLIEDLLDMSRIVAGKLRIAPRAIDARQIMDAAIETVATAAQANQISIVRYYQADGAALWADPDRLQQIVWNLLSNAIKFSPPKSTVSVALRRAGHSVIIEVADEGEGIAAEFLPHIFERFRQGVGSVNSRNGGLGLGLSIVKQLVELHGGKIQAASAGIGHGTRIILTLPELENSAALRLPDEPKLPTKKLQGIRVLVVDDDLTTCEMIARILREQHSEVLAVTSVDRAIQAMDEFEPNVIVSDIAMPERDGYELLRQVRSRKPSAMGCVPAMALTALSSPDDQKRAFEAGYRLHLAKPVEPSALTDAVAELAQC